MRGPTPQHDPDPSSPSPQDDEIGTTKMSARTMRLLRSRPWKSLLSFLRHRASCISCTGIKHISASPYKLPDQLGSSGHMPIGGLRLITPVTPQVERQNRSRNWTVDSELIMHRRQLMSTRLFRHCHCHRRRRLMLAR